MKMSLYQNASDSPVIIFRTQSDKRCKQNILDMHIIGFHC